MEKKNCSVEYRVEVDDPTIRISQCGDIGGAHSCIYDIFIFEEASKLEIMQGPCWDKCDGP